MADRLKSYDESIRHFFQNASHELKTPLMSINGYVDSGIRTGFLTARRLTMPWRSFNKEKPAHAGT